MMNRMLSRWIVAGFAIMLAGGPAAAQMKIAYAPQGEAANLQVIALRPNVTQPIYFSYYNPGPGVKKNVKVTLEQVIGDKSRVLAETVLAKVDLKKSAPVAFTNIPSPKDPAAPWPTLGAPPFAFRFVVNDGATTTINVPVKLQEPREYVNVREARYDPEKRRLSFKLGSDEPLDPPCPVELVLQPSALPGLVQNAAGTFKQKLSKENLEVELSATNVEFEGGVPQYGRIYLTVDGFERAHMYKCAFAEGSLTALKDETRVRVVAARYSLPSTKIPIVIEIDSKSQQEGDEDALQRSLVEVAFDRAGQGSFEKAIGSPFRGLRELSIEYKADGEALLFKTKVKDRVVELDAESINGPRTLQVRLTTSKQRVIPIANELDAREEKLALSADYRFAPLSFDAINDIVSAKLILDSTPAEDLKITNVPLKARPEELLKPRLTFKTRLKAAQAPVEKISFFFGEADKNHKAPEKIQKFEAIWDKALEAYVPKDEMRAPTELGKLFVSAHVETATGVLMSKKSPLTIVSKDAQDGGGNVLTTIDGVIMRSERAQPGVTVILAKSKPNKDDVPKEAKTKDDGKFEFADVEPGLYVISARRLDTVAVLPIRVEKNKDKLSVKLELKAK